MKIIQFNWLHPQEFVRKEQNSIPELAGCDVGSFADWLKENGFGMTDLFTDYFEKKQVTVVNYFWSEDLFKQKFVNIEKLEITDGRLLLRYFRSQKIKEIYQFFTLKSKRAKQLAEIKLIKHISAEKADILLIREPAGLDHRVLKMVKKKCRLKAVAVIGCEFKLIEHFKPKLYNAAFTLTEEFYSYFKSHGCKAFLFKYGFYDYATSGAKLNDIVFAGDLAADVQKDKAELMNAVAANYDFKWWGPHNVNSNTYPALFKSFQGMTAGSHMLNIYATSKIVLNDYPANAKGDAVNMRIWDAISAGSFLITRDSENLADLKKAGLAVFRDTEDCLQQISYWLKSNEREAVAMQVKTYCSKNYNLENSLSDILSEMKAITAKV